MPETVDQRHYRRHRVERIEQSKARALRGRQIIDEFKAQPCARCWMRYPACVMDLHHLDEKDPAIKAKSIGCMLTYSEKRLRAELEKCVPLCANCHRITHNAPGMDKVAL